MENTENELYAELVFLIAKDFYLVSQLDRLSEDKDWRPPQTGEKGSINHHLHTSCFENCADILYRLNIIEMVSCHDGLVKLGRGNACCYWLMNLNEVRDFIAALDKNEREKVDIENVLSGWLDIACNYGDGSLYDGRDSFKAAPDDQRIMALLSSQGYAKKSGNKFKWTDQIAPAMQSVFVWNDNLESERVVQEKMQDQEALQAWNLMPADMKTVLINQCKDQKFDLISLVKLLVLNWKNGQWVHSDKQGQRMILKDGKVLAEKIFEIIKKENL